MNFIPDGKTKGMSILSHSVDAAQTNTGKPGDKPAADKKQGKQEGAADGKLSKKDLKKMQKKEAKKEKKAGNAPDGGDAN